MPSAKHSKLIDGLILLLGVGLPLATLAIEAATGMCANAFFDPIPTLWHALLVASVPFFNLLLFLAVRYQRTEPRWRLGLGAGFAAGVSLSYSLLFLPLLPMAAVAVVFYGLGLLPWAPVCGLVATGVNYRRLVATDLEIMRRGGGFWPGVIAALLVVFGLNATETVTHVGLQMATDSDPDTRRQGVRLLRAVGREDSMLRACYERTWRPLDLFGRLYHFDDPVTTDEARAVWYRVTGTPFNAVAAPRLTRSRGWQLDELEFDADQGGATVAGRLKNLELASSRLDGTLDPDAALAYLEWTMVFKNTGATQLEARTQVALPPGGVVSRLTLWIDGEEREAAFAGRGQVREAYERVVRTRRDPVLVTTSGPDRVLVQCFPVPPGSEMKIRFGITAPLQLENLEAGLLRLPHLVERNFNLRGELAHQVWLESKHALAGNEALRTERAGEAFALRGALPDSALTDGRATVRADRSAAVLEAWTDDPFGEAGARIRQTLAEQKVTAPNRLVMVIDGSRRMEPYRAQIANALERFPAQLEFAVLTASEDESALNGRLQRGPVSLVTVAGQLKELETAGGQDNLPALVQAWELAAGQPGSAILWIHGPQPVELESPEALEQRWQRRPDGPRLYTLAAEAGPNRVLEALGGRRAVQAVPRFGTLEEDLERLFALWSAERAQLVTVRERLEAARLPTPNPAWKTSAHLARLWARDEVLRRIDAGQAKELEEAVPLAARYQLVTPVSGAVVLETQAQYEAAGLSPVSAGSVPTVPEPHEWALMIIVALALGWTWRRRAAWAL